MRPTLENIEFIENYILGNFDPNEHKQAKQRIDGSPELSHLLNTQQCIYSATKRKALRSEIQAYSPASTPSMFQRYRYWFAGGLSALAIIAGFAIFNSKDSIKKQTTTYSFESQISKNEQNVVPWIPFDVQFFDLIAEKGATIVGKDGTLIILGENSLLDSKGNHISGKVEAELIEALDFEDMIAYNLTTSSAGKALSSGGMMRICYKQGRQEVFVDPQKPMHIEIPTDEYNPDMKVWEGEVKDDLLDWNNPQEIECYLTTIDLKYLDFIPAGFDSEVAALLPYKNHSQLSDRLVDSLYYSISSSRDLYSNNQESKSSFVNDCYFNIPRRKDLRNSHPHSQTKPLLKGKNSVTGQIVDSDGKPIKGMNVTLRMDRYLEHEESITTDDNGNFTFSKFYPGEVAIYASLHSLDQDDILWKYCLESTFICPKKPSNYVLEKPLVAEYSSLINFDNLSATPKTGGCFIDPLAIKTLKQHRFQNTFIATQAFEMRLQAMHQLKQGASVLDIYINNISKPLYKCDHLAANLLSGKEKILFENFAKEKLTNVENSGIHDQAVREFYDNQRKEYRKENRERLTELNSMTTKEIRRIQLSLEATLSQPKEIALMQAEQKGRTLTSSEIVQQSSRESSRPRSNSYSFSWYSSSWINIDRYMEEIGFNPWITAINTSQNQENTRVFQCTRESKTVLELTRLNGSYETIFPKTHEIDKTFCLAMSTKENQLLYDSRTYDPSIVRDITLNLSPISQEDFYLKLCSLAPEQSGAAKQLRNKHNQLTSQAKINNALAPLSTKLTTASNKITSEAILYNHLFDYLNSLDKNLIQ